MNIPASSRFLSIPFYGHPLFSMENIYRAYMACRRRKRGTHNAMRFEAGLEENVFSLRQELESGSYRPGRSIVFMVKRPKKREIFAADFRDRVVHHILVSHLEPVWERRFIPDSFACRKGRGTHRGVERLREMTRKVTCNCTRKAWYLQLDIRGFFMSIDRRILFERICSAEKDPAVLWLAEKFVFHDPVRNCLLRRVSMDELLSLPEHKTLFKAEPSRGLPIGNLTSQFFANVYLDALDQFVKRILCARFYIRYCDDFVILHNVREKLLEIEREVSQFLRKKLALSLNERRKLRPVRDGIDFLGYVIRPEYLLTRRRVVIALKDKLRQAEAFFFKKERPWQTPVSSYPWKWNGLLKLRSILCSYAGHFIKASFFNLVEEIKREFPWLSHYFLWEKGKVCFRFPQAPSFLSCYKQVSWFFLMFRYHILLLQKGCFFMVREPGNSVYFIRQGALNLLQKRFATAHFPLAVVTETGKMITTVVDRQLETIVCNNPGHFVIPARNTPE